MATEFNSNASPKIKTECFKIYADVGGATSPTWELQGRGIESWTLEENSSINKTPDVLGYIDMERDVSQPTQSGVQIKLRKGSLFGQMLFDAWFKHDTSKIDSIKMLQKFEFVDGTGEGTCLARLEDEVMIGINNFTGEAGGFLGFEVDIHYANKTTFGTMPKVDGDTITFTPDSAA